jgi:Sigma-70, region 4
VRELPAGYRTIFVLHEIKGYEHQEIARILKCSVGNSKSQLHKAKLKMRELLGYGPNAIVQEQAAETKQRRAELNRVPAMDNPYPADAWHASVVEDLQNAPSWLEPFPA